MKSSAELIADLWYIIIDKAKETLEANTQWGTRSAIFPLRHKYLAGRVYSLKSLNSRFATYAFFSDMNLLNQNVCVQVFSHKIGLSATYPMWEGSGYTIGQSDRYFCHDYSVTEHLTFNVAIVKIGKNTPFMKTMKKYGISKKTKWKPNWRRNSRNKKEMV